MAFFIKNNSSGSWYTVTGVATTYRNSIETNNDPSECKHGYATSSLAESAISKFSLTNVTIVEE